MASGVFGSATCVLVCCDVGKVSFGEVGGGATGWFGIDLFWRLIDGLGKGGGGEVVRVLDGERNLFSAVGRSLVFLSSGYH